MPTISIDVEYGQLFDMVSGCTRQIRCLEWAKQKRIAKGDATDLKMERDLERLRAARDLLVAMEKQVQPDIKELIDDPGRVIQTSPAQVGAETQGAGPGRGISCGASRASRLGLQAPASHLERDAAVSR